MRIFVPRPAVLAAVGLFVACAAAAASVPSLPLRLWLPSLLLLAAVLLPARIVEESLRTWTLVAVWVWVAGCVLLAPPGPWRAAGLGLVALGLALGLPAAAAGLREARYFSRPLDTGLAIGSALLGVLGLALGFLWPQRIPVRFPALSLVLGVSFLGYLAARAGDGEGRQRRRAAAAGLLLAAVAGLAGVGRWRSASLRAAGLEQAAAGAVALQATEVEVARARRLGLTGALADALRRRARVCQRAGDRAARREALREVAALDRSDLDTLRELFLLAQEDRSGSQELLDSFRRLPDSMVEAAAAGRVVTPAFRAADWEVFARAWRLSGGQTAAGGLSPGELAAAGEALFFTGDYRTAAGLLRRSLEHRPDWHALRILFFALLRDGRAGEARELLAGAAAAGHETEAAWLRSRLESGADQAAGDGGVFFEGVLKLTGCTLEVGTAVPGTEIAVSFAWAVQLPVPPGWRVFVHLRREVYGGFFFQGDHEFGDVGHPSRELACGSRFGYTVRVPVPREAPPGDYSVTVGLWDGRDNRPLAAVPPLPPGFRVAAGNRVRVEPGLRLVAGKPTD